VVLAIHRIDSIAEPERVTYALVCGALQRTGYALFFENITSDPSWPDPLLLV
jgi:hypothetical protein